MEKSNEGHKIKEAIKPKSCKELLREYALNASAGYAEKLKFCVAEGLDVYNITAPFLAGNEMIIAGRVEPRESEISKVMFFKKKEGSWIISHEGIYFDRFQDPFITRVDGKLILGGVQVINDPLDRERIISFRTLFYRGESIDSLKLFAAGPMGMKDIRIIQLKDGKIGVFTRPNRNEFGMGKIGFIKIDSLDALNEITIKNAKIVDTHFVPGEWGGCNEAYLLEDGLVGVLGHISYWENESIMHYHSMAFVFDPETQKHTPVKIIATRSDFINGPAKRSELKDVVFSGGLVKKDNEKYILYAGVSDAEAHCIEIKNPFTGY